MVVFIGMFETKQVLILSHSGLNKLTSSQSDNSQSYFALFTFLHLQEPLVFCVSLHSSACFKMLYKPAFIAKDTLKRTE